MRKLKTKVNQRKLYQKVAKLEGGKENQSIAQLSETGSNIFYLLDRDYTKEAQLAVIKKAAEAKRKRLKK